jgi:excisionase family DNA binding protein
MTDRLYLRPKTVAAMLDTPESTVRDWCARGVLRHHRVLETGKSRGSILIPRDAVDELLEKSRVGAR